VSSVHLGYSGRLKPKAVLEELKRLEYGWEKELLTDKHCMKKPQKATKLGIRRGFWGFEGFVWRVFLFLENPFPRIGKNV